MSLQAKHTAAMPPEARSAQLEHHTAVAPYGSNLATRAEWQASMATHHGIDTEAVPESYTITDLWQEEGTAKAAYAVLAAYDLGQAPQVTGTWGLRMLQVSQKLLEASPMTMKPQRQMLGAIALTNTCLALRTPALRKFIQQRDVTQQVEQWHAAWPATSTQLVQGVQHGIAQGYIPANVAERLPDAIEKTRVRIADTIVPPTLTDDSGAEAVYRPDQDTVVVTSDDKRNAIHEFLHKLSGGTFIRQNGNTPITRTRLGDVQSVRRNTRNSVTEALNEHLTQGVLTGDFATIDPLERDESDSVLRQERRVIAVFVKHSGGLITPQTMTRPQFEDTEPDGSFTERRALVQAARAAYGPGALQKLAKLCSYASYEDDSTFNRFMLGRIIAPVLNDDGSVRQRGSIRI